MAERPDDDPSTALRRLRPAQDDVVARRMAARIRGAVTGAPAVPVRLGRFEVQELLGSGGMGTVFAAFDPKLDRKVAIKVLHGRDTAARDRVLAEARALAKLSHPNVIAIYDASDDRDDLYIAMELVAGANLRAWIAETAPPRGVLLARLHAAGRGLAAAHAAGLVHGDIKPENILVAGDVVKVADFGLARAEHDPSLSARSGTPAYMAPEQLAGGAVDARSDQFAFAVTVYEALSGSRPFAGDTLEELAAAIRAGRIAALDLPAPVMRALERALSADPAQRFASLEPLLSALAPRTRRWPLVAALAALTVAGITVAIVLGSRNEAPRCDAGAERVAAALPADLLSRLAPRAATALAAQGHAWATMADSTCRATERGEQSAPLLDLRMACLDRRLDELAALAAELSALTPDAQITAAQAPSALEPCADRERLLGVLPVPPGRRGEVAAFYKELARVAAQQKTGQHAAALAQAAELVTRARALAYAPALADALVILGKLENHASLHDAADATLKEATIAAAEARDDELLAEAWTARIYIAAIRGKLTDAIAYSEAAESAAARLAKPARARGTMHMYLGYAYEQQDKLAEARASTVEAIAQLTEARGAEHASVGEAHHSLAQVCLVQGDLECARTHAHRAIEILEAAYGPDHQDTTVAVAMLANIAGKEGKLADAEVVYRDVLRRTLASAGPDHAYTSVAHFNLGDTLRKLGRLDEARVELEAARAIDARIGGDSETSLRTLGALAKLEQDPATRAPLLEDLLARQTKVFGPTNRMVSDTINDLGNAARDAGDLDGATAYFERALAGYEASLGPTHARVAIPLSNLGEIAIARKQFAAALTWCRRALAIDEAALGPDHPDLAYDLTCVGEAELGLGRRAPAREQLERALALRTKAGVTGSDLARTQAALARATR